MTNNEIKFRKGINHILLIAPHGVYGDDDNCGTLTSALADRLKSYAVINEHYQRDISNLNSLDDIIYDDELISSYLMPIVEYKKTIAAEHGAVFIVHVHGVDDGNIQVAATEKDTDILIGIGLPVKELSDEDIHPPACLSAQKTLAKKLIKLLAKYKQHPIKAEIARQKYAARDEDNLNQLFTRQNAYDPAVQSIQLEIKKTDFRDTEENIQRTADALSSALAELAGLKTTTEAEVLPDEKQPVAEEQELHISQIEASYETTNAETETEVNRRLVKKASDKLRNIFSEHFGKAMLEAGNYLIETFYNGSYDLAFQKKPVKGKSLDYLIKQLKQDDKSAPSRAWIFRAIQLSVEDKRLEKLIPESVYTYRQLYHSHRVLLLPIEDIQIKEQLIQETAEKKYTISQLKDRLAMLVQEDKPTIEHTSLPRIINNPDKLFSDEYSSFLTTDYLSQLPDKTVTRVQKLTKAKIEDIDKEIERQRLIADNYRALLKTIDEAKAATPDDVEVEKEAGLDI